MNAISTKITAGLIAGSLASILVWILSVYHITLPGEVDTSIVTLLTFGVGFFVPETATNTTPKTATPTTKASTTMSPTAADGTEYNTYGGVNDRPTDVNHPDNLTGPVAGASSDPALNPQAGTPGNITPAIVTEQNIGGPVVDATTGAPTGETVTPTYDPSSGALTGSTVTTDTAPGPTNSTPEVEGVDYIIVDGIRYNKNTAE